MNPSTRSTDAQFSVSEFFHPESIVQDGRFSVLDEADAKTENSLAYCQNLYHLQRAIRNPCVSAIICPPDLASEVPTTGIAVIVAPDPRLAYFELYVKLSEGPAMWAPVDRGRGRDCTIHASATISPETHIGDRVTIGPNSVILSHCTIGDDVEIGPNVVIGTDGLLTIRKPNGTLLKVRHAGGVEIEDGCQILAGAIVAKSLYRSFTHIGEQSQIGIMANIGHGTRIGKRCVISGNTVVAGRTIVGDDAWVGTSVAIAQGLAVGENAQIKMGAIVVSNVPSGAVVSGNFAVNHRITMARYLKEGH